MKRLTLTLFLALASLTMLAQRALLIQHPDGVTDAVPTEMIDEITFSDDFSQLLLKTGESLVTLSRDAISAMNYGAMPSSFTVTYAEDKASVVNPYLLQGVTAMANGAHVTVDNANTTTELTFELKGTTTGGGFLYNGDYKTTIVLNGVTINNPAGPAIDIQCGKRVALELKKGTESTLSDGADGDWKAALYCKGHLEVDKSGTLNVSGHTRHAISAKEYIQLKKSDGTINILSSKGDGIHCQQYFLANGYTININNVEGDGIQAELSGDEAYAEDYPDGSLYIQGGNITINDSFDDADALKADGNVVINTVKSVPVINITMTGAGGKGINADGTLTIGEADAEDGPQISIKTTGQRSTTASSKPHYAWGGGGWPGGPGGGGPGGGPGGESESGSSAKAIKAQGAIVINSGSIEISTAGNGAEGIESKTSLDINGGKHYLKTYDDAINCSGRIAFNGGITVCLSTGNDAVDSNYGRTGAIVIGDGVLFSYSSRGGAEMGLDCDGNSMIQITGHGIAIAAGGQQGGGMSSTTLGTAVQGYTFLTNTISFTTGRYYTLADNAGTNLVTFAFDANVSSQCTMLTANGMVKGSTYTLKYSTSAPTDAATVFHGLYLGSSAVGTSSVTSFTAK